jgi:acetylornithine deacetylase/succinyl-diaminopimelate desuccinylase-like protein
MAATEVKEYARDNAEDFEKRLLEFVSIPSISTLPEHTADCERAAQWLAESMRSAGLENVDVISGPGRPLVYGDWLHADGAPVVLVYGHYDVQPVDPIDEWQSNPFEPVVREGFVYGRGAADDKGHVAILVDAVESYLKSRGSLPVNLRFLIEGEEESGGEHIKEFLNSGDARLQADFAHVADTSFFSADVPSVDSGLRGIVYTEVHVRAVDHDLHSGEFGGVSPNPLNSLAHLISRLRDDSGIVTIPGFYRDVASPPRNVLDGWATLGVTPESVAREIGARTIIGDPGYSPLERMWSRPTLDVHGIAGGFTGGGAKTVIPAVASAKISMRLVPDQKADVVFKMFEEAVLALTPPDVEVRVELIHGDDPVVVPDDTPEIQAAKQALGGVYGKEAVTVRTGGSIPVVGLFQEKLGLPSVLLGFGLPGANLHAPNERFSVDQFHKGIETTVDFWDAVRQR